MEPQLFKKVVFLVILALGSAAVFMRMTYLHHEKMQELNATIENAKFQQSLIENQVYLENLPWYKKLFTNTSEENYAKHRRREKW